MLRFLLSLLLALNFAFFTFAATWQTIDGPTVLEGAVVSADFDPSTLDKNNQVQHFVWIVITKAVSGDARPRKSVVFSFREEPRQLFENLDLIRVSLEDNNMLVDFSTIEKLGKFKEIN